MIFIAGNIFESVGCEMSPFGSDLFPPELLWMAASLRYYCEDSFRRTTGPPFTNMV